MTIFVISDTHFQHRNIIKYCNRPYNEVSIMNDSIITIWNKTVKSNDHVYFLGDFGIGGSQILEDCFNRLNGKKYLIRGNHDEKPTINLKWEWIKDTYFLNGKYFFSHYPHSSWNKSYHGSFHCFGHVHSQGSFWCNGLSVDVGFDMWGKPVSLEELDSLRSYLKENTGDRHFMWRGHVNDRSSFEFVFYDDIKNLAKSNKVNNQVNNIFKE